MASVYKVKDRSGKKQTAWRYKFKDYTGAWRYGVGWPGKQQTLDHALAVEAEHRAIRKGEKEIPPEWLKSRNRPIQETIGEYIEWGKAGGGRRGYGWSKGHLTNRGLTLRFWVRELGLRTLADIDLARVEAKTRELSGRGLTGKTVAGYCEALKALCTYAVKHRYLKENPLAGMGRFDVSPKCPHRALTDEEVRRLIEVASQVRRLLYRTALATGYRAGELRALKVRDLDVFGCSLRLAGEFTKNRKDARQPISRGLSDALREAAKDKGPESALLHMPRKETVNMNLQRDCAKARIRRKTADGKATFHSFRVNYINAVVESGSDLKTIMTLARHGSAQMSMETYAKPKPDRLRAAAEAVSERLDETISGRSCCAYVAQAVAGSKEHPVTPSGDRSYGALEVVRPPGFEPGAS